jgi:hypothetical protein
VLLEVLLGSGHELDGGEFVAAMHQHPIVSYRPMPVGVAAHPLRSKRWMISPMRPRYSNFVSHYSP